MYEYRGLWASDQIFYPQKTLNCENILCFIFRLAVPVIPVIVTFIR